jgi:hypothetical protein
MLKGDGSSIEGCIFGNATLPLATTVITTGESGTSLVAAAWPPKAGDPLGTLEYEIAMFRRRDLKELFETGRTAASQSDIAFTSTGRGPARSNGMHQAPGGWIWSNIAELSDMSHQEYTVERGKITRSPVHPGVFFERNILPEFLRQRRTIGEIATFLGVSWQLRTA